MRPRIWAISAALLLLLTMLVGGLRVDPPTQPVVGHAVVTPGPPLPEPYDPAGDLAVLQSRSPWGVRGASLPRGEPAVPRALWRLIGISSRSDGAVVALLLQPQNRVEYRRAGEVLPDGRRIVAIHAASIDVEAAGVHSTLPLFTGLR
jgi:hypothetical protein